MPITIIHKAFSELSLTELYDLMALRQEVFVVEQDCPYQDADGKDQSSYHVMAHNASNELVAYARIVKPGISYETYSSIGRVVSSPSARGQGAGKQLMEYAIAQTKQLFPLHNIKISAQSYILEFYKNLGFVAIGDEYLEDDIPHKAMILDTSA